MPNPHRSDIYARFLPFPMASVVMSEPMIAAAGNVYRCALAIAAAYWLGGCREIPTGIIHLASLARMALPHISTIKPALEATLAEILPPLKTQYDAARKTAAHRKALANMASSIAAQKKRERYRDGKSISGGENPARIQPVKMPPWQGDPHTDERQRRDVGTRQTTAQTAHGKSGSHGLLRDTSVSVRK